MPRPYTPVPSFYRERFTIAALCGERIALHWRDADGELCWFASVAPREVLEEDGIEWLLAESDAGEMLRIRMDLIENMPRPVK